MSEQNLLVLAPKPKNFKKWTLIALSVFFILIILLSAAAAFTAYNYQNEIYPGIRLSDLDLGGLTKTQAAGVISGKFKQTYDSGFSFVFENINKKINDSDNAILKLNLDSQVNAAYQLGRKDSAVVNYAKIIFYSAFNKNIKLDYQLDKDLLKDRLSSEFNAAEQPAREATIVLNIIDPKTRTYDLSFSSSQTGERFNFNEAINELEKNARKLTNSEIRLVRGTDYPKITTEQALSQTEKIKELLSIPEVALTFGDKTWTIKWEDFSHWVALTLDEQEKTAVGLNEEMIRGQLDAIAQEINQKAVDAKLQIKDGRVTEFKASQNGQELDEEKNLQKITEEILNNHAQKIELIVTVTEPTVSVDKTNELGIRELVGVGYSDFSGSPVNRRHNIGIGAAALNGVLIEPREEFSLVKSLGAIDAEHGYLPELVIKKNKTVPEYGGGLCQIATTVFRAALASGLKITYRQNHAYRVPYYEPAGTDATIYDPWPDVRFVNDTENYILVQTKLWGNNLNFEFWGTTDSRKVSFEGQNKTNNLKELKPKIFNVTVPGPAKEVETEELNPGEKKRVEYAHNGADTVFYRYITYADGREAKETWASHYVPWQAVFLVGIDPTTKETANPPEQATPLPLNNPTDSTAPPPVIPE